MTFRRSALAVQRSHAAERLVLARLVVRVTFFHVQALGIKNAEQKTLASAIQTTRAMTAEHGDLAQIAIQATEKNIFDWSFKNSPSQDAG